MSDLEDRLRRGHPEERAHRPVPFAEIAARPRPLRPAAGAGWWRLAPLIAAAFVLAVTAVLTQPIGLPDGDASRVGVAPARPASSAPVGFGASEPAVECGPAGETECAQIVDAARRLAHQPIIEVDIRAYEPACMRASLCDLPAFEPWLADVRTDSGRIGLLCDAADGSASCSEASVTELVALATLVLRVEGADRQTVLLRDESGIVWRRDADPELEQDLTVGRWSVVASGDQDCSAVFDAEPAEQLDVIIRILDRERCRIEVR